MGHLNPLECSDGEFSGELAWNFGCRHVIDFNGPGNLKVLAVTGIRRSLSFTQIKRKDDGFHSFF